MRTKKADREPQEPLRLVDHEHRPPICCGTMWRRQVDLTDPDTYRVVGEPARIPAGRVDE